MLETIQGEIRAEPLNNNFSLLYDGLKNSKASVPDYEFLPTEGNEDGDYRIVTGGEYEGQLFWWDGTEWRLVEQDADGVHYDSGIEDVPKTVAGILGFLGENSIVKHNLDNPAPTNGWYIKFANKLGVCWKVDNGGEDEVEEINVDGTLNTITMPISNFVDGTVSGGVAYGSNFSAERKKLLNYPPMSYTTRRNWNVIISADANLFDKGKRISRRSYWAFGIWSD